MPQPMTTRVLEVMRTRPDADWRPSPIADLLGVPPDRVTNALYRLRRWGYTESPQSGVHRLAPEVEEAAPPAPEPTPEPEPEPLPEVTPAPASPPVRLPLHRLPSDLRQTHELLVKHGGMGARLAACYLNVSYSRAERLLADLVRHDYAACENGTYRRKES